MKIKEQINTLKEIDHKTLHKIIQLIYDRRGTLFIWGKTGIGKSDTVRATARDIAKNLQLEYSEDISHVDKDGKFCLIDLRISQLDPSDLRGIPIINDQKDKTEWKRPNWFPTHGHGILFLDEINLAPPLVQNAAYQIILDRRCGAHQLADGYVVIAAGNRAEDSINVQEVAAPLLNRFMHVVLKVPTYTEWSDWAIKHDIDPRILLFLQRKDLLFDYRPESTDAAFPTPRTWYMLSRNIKGITDIDFIEALAMGTVGQAAGFEFATFLRLANEVPSPEEIIANKGKITIQGTNSIDKLYFMIASYIHYMLHEFERLDKKELKRVAKKYITIFFNLLLSVNQSELAFVALKYLHTVTINKQQFQVNGSSIFEIVYSDYKQQPDGARFIERFAKHII